MLNGKWLLKVTENGQHAYNKWFRTKKQALEYAEKISRFGAKWGFEITKPEVTK